MYAQFFGNYLLNKRVVTTDQLMQAIAEQHIRHLKVGTLAIHAGYMNAEQVDHILLRQTTENKQFGDLAIEEGYLTRKQLEDVLNRQIPIYLLIGQRLVENGVLTDAALEELIHSYQEENDLSSLENSSMHQENLQTLIRNLFLITVSDIPDYLLKYLTLLFGNLIRFIGDDFMPLNPELCREYVTNHCTGQIINGEFSLTSYIDMDEDALIAFASRYTREEFHESNEYVQASAEDFLNLHNGLFNVNVSIDHSVELLLNPPVNLENTLISTSSDIIHMPIVYPFGTLDFLFKL